MSAVNNNEVIFSFCIPTYNRAKLVKTCINNIQKIKSDNIEIVVIDNNSTDETVEVIDSINDSRISFYKNEVNIGSVMNVIETIKRARGQWLFLLSDEDLIETNNVSSIINKIISGEYSDAAVILGNILNEDGSFHTKYRNNCYLKGDDAVSGIGFFHDYLSGIILNRKFLNENIVNQYTRKDGMYPHVNIYTQLCKSGNAYTIDMTLCTIIKFFNRKSYVEKLDGEFYFHPINVLKQFKIFINIANSTIVDNTKKAGTISKLYFKYLSKATFSWENILRVQHMNDYFDVGNAPEFNFWEELNRFYSSSIDYINLMVENQNDIENIIKRFNRINLLFKCRRISGPIWKPTIYIFNRLNLICSS